MPIDADNSPRAAQASRRLPGHRASAWLHTACILALFVCWAVPALAAEGEPAATVTLGFKSLFIAVAGAIGGWFLKLAADLISGRFAARQKFTDEITDQITDLAKQHYWSLANHAGVLAGLLEDYLYRVDYNLLLQYDSASDLNDNLAVLAKSFADQTFYSFCRLIWLFDRFQFEGSNTYLLTTGTAGRSSRQLYNSFITTLPESGEGGQGSLDLGAIIAAMRRKGQENTAAGTNATDDVTAAEFGRMLAKPGDPFNLVGSQAAYREWLAARPDQVTIAAQSLRAYNELLSHELANLYRDWFRRKKNSDLTFAEPAAFHTWPDILTEESVKVITRARSDSELLQALGRGVASNRSSELQENSASGDGTPVAAAPQGSTDTAARSVKAAGAPAGGAA